MPLKEKSTENKKRRKSRKPPRVRMLIGGEPVGRLSGGTDGMCHKDDLPEIKRLGEWVPSGRIDRIGKNR